MYTKGIMTWSNGVRFKCSSPESGHGWWPLTLFQFLVSQTSCTLTRMKLLTWIELMHGLPFQAHTLKALGYLVLAQKEFKVSTDPFLRLGLLFCEVKLELRHMGRWVLHHLEAVMVVLFSSIDEHKLNFQIPRCYLDAGVVVAFVGLCNIVAVCERVKDNRWTLHLEFTEVEKLACAPQSVVKLYLVDWSTV